MEKHSGKFFVLIAGLIIFAHAVIPHHHHFDSIDSHAEKTVCETSNSEKHNDNPKTHCHALNIVVTEKAGNSTIATALLQLGFDFYIPPNSRNLEFVRNSLIQPISFICSLPEQIFLTSRSLRAPPVTA